MSDTAIMIIGTEDLHSAGTVLAKNTSYVSTYEKKADKLLEKATKEGVMLSKETDEEINNFLVSAKKCLSTMEEERKPYTQKLQAIVSMFTAQENKLRDDIYSKLQAKRDLSAKEWAKKEAADRAAEQLKLDKEKERIELFAEAETYIRTGYAQKLAADKAELLDLITRADADTIDGVVDVLQAVDPVFSEESFKAIGFYLTGRRLIDAEELPAIIDKAREGKLEKIQPHYNTELKAYAEYLLTIIPERRKEIAEGAASKAAEEIRLREEEELAKQTAESEKRAEEEKSKQIAAAVVDSEINKVTLSARMPTSKPIESYNITVLKREGWAEIFKFYFTHSPEEDLGKIKLDQMKAFAERYAKSNGTKIESDALVYEPTYKTQARGKKAA